MAGITVIQIQVEGFDKNFSYLIVDQISKDTLLVDPCGDIERVFKVMEEQSLNLKGVLITHTHFDHHEKLEVVLRTRNMPTYLHKNAKGRTAAKGENERLIEHKGHISLGKGFVHTFYTPGHHDDCLCFYIAESDAADGVPKLISGDTLFVGGCGRTTENGVKQLYESLQFLKTFPSQTEVYSGHDYGRTPISTMLNEKQHNKYLLANTFLEFKAIRLPKL